MAWKTKQLDALRIMMDGKSIFLTGKAGTGKSTVANAFIKRKLEDGKSIVAVAPTGIAALNVNGVTMHRAFGLPIDYLPKSTMLHTRTEIKEALAKADIIIVDEISMVRGDVFSHIEHVLRISSHQNGSIFGGKQVVLVGDLYQLPPVVIGHDENNLMRDYGGTFAFETKAWRLADFEIVELDEVVRQGDQQFVDWLNSIRESDANINQTIFDINELIADKPKPEDCTTICFTNRAASLINREKLGKIAGQPIVFSSVVDGIVNESDKPTDDELQIKLGANVMTIVNGEDYVNGTVGTVTAFSDDTITIDGTITVERYVWKIKGLKLNAETKVLEDDIIGTFEQFPVKLAWAITAHKSQGQTLSGNVHLEMDGVNRSHGQFYVAISRCTDINNLTLGRPIYNSDIVVSDKVRSFMLMSVMGKVTMEVPKMLLPLFNNMLECAARNPSGEQIEKMIERTQTWLGMLK